MRTLHCQATPVAETRTQALLPPLSRLLQPLCQPSLAWPSGEPAVGRPPAPAWLEASGWRVYTTPERRRSRPAAELLERPL